MRPFFITAGESTNVPTLKGIKPLPYDAGYVVPTNSPSQGTQKQEDPDAEYIGYSTTASSKALRAFSIRSGQLLCEAATENTPNQCSLSPSGKYLGVATSRVCV